MSASAGEPRSRSSASDATRDAASNGRTPRSRACGGRGRALRNGRAPRRDQAYRHPGAPRQGNRRVRVARATHRPARRRSGTPFRNGPCRPAALQWRAPRRRSSPRIRDRGRRCGSSHAAPRCAMSAPCPRASSGRDCGGHSCGLLLAIVAAFSVWQIAYANPASTTPCARQMQVKLAGLNRLPSPRCLFAVTSGAH